MAQPAKTAAKSVSELFEALERRSFTSYKSRLRAWERIQSRSRAWNAALISLATATTVASVGLLVDGTMYGKSGAALLAACAVLSLAVSLVVASLDYPGRAVRMETNYKEIQNVSTQVEAARNTGSSPTIGDYETLNATYIDTHKHSENHSTADLHASQGRWSTARLASGALTLLPYLALLLPGWLMWQFGSWVVSGAR